MKNRRVDCWRLDFWRFDESKIEIDEVTGWLTMEGTAALVGVMQYDDTSEYVPPETLADVESLLSAPLTVQHPPQNLDLETTRQYQVGTVLSARLDDGKLRVRIRVTDSEAVAAIQSGTRELSPGYLAELDRTPGLWSGKKYDAIQTKRRYNHLALVDRARGGRQARLDGSRNSLDSWRADGALIQRTDAQMETVTIDGVEYQVPPEVAAIVTAWQASQEPAVDAEGAETPAAPSPTPGTPAAPAAKTPSSITVKMDAEEITALENRIVSALRHDRELEKKNAVALGETVALVRPLLPQSYRVDGKDAGTLVADAIVAKRPDLAGWVKQHRTDGSRLRGMLDSMLTGEAPDNATEAEHADAETSDDPISAAQNKQAERLSVKKPLAAVAGGKA
jgi:hypothetical protein